MSRLIIDKKLIVGNDYFTKINITKPDIDLRKLIINRFAKSLENIAEVENIILFGSLSENRFVEGFSDMDVLVLTNPSGLKKAECWKNIAEAIFKSTYLKVKFNPYVFTKDEMRNQINPFFSANVIDELKKNHEILKGNNITKELKISKTKGFPLDLFFYRSWLRRQACQPSLMLNISVCSKAALRWTKVALNYVQKHKLYYGISKKDVKEFLNYIGNEKRNFTRMRPTQKLKLFIRMLHLFEYVSEIILAQNKRMQKYEPVRNLNRLSNFYLQVFNYIKPWKKTLSNSFLDLELIFEEDNLETF